MNLEKIALQPNADLHVHTRYSSDSFLCPKKIVAFANRHKKIIAITDHDEILGALEAKKYDRENRIIIGEEIETSDWGGEILAFGIREKIGPAPALEVIGEIRRQGGTAVLSHSFRQGYIFKKNTKPIPREIIEKIDGVEVWNARSSRRENQRALELAEKYGKIKTRGSDAHMLWELYFFGQNFALINLLKNIITFSAKFFKGRKR